MGDFEGIPETSQGHRESFRNLMEVGWIAPLQPVAQSPTEKFEESKGMLQA
jgi:hypothetical protein